MCSLNWSSNQLLRNVCRDHLAATHRTFLETLSLDRSFSAGKFKVPEGLAEDISRSRQNLGGREGQGSQSQSTALQSSHARQWPRTRCARGPCRCTAGPVALTELPSGSCRPAATTSGPYHHIGSMSGPSRHPRGSCSLE